MRKFFSVLVVLLIAVFAVSAQERFENWPEMMHYHEILAQTFHPAEEGDLKPIKARSHELYTNCKKLNAGKIPREFDNERVRKALNELEKESDKLNAYIVRQEQNAVVMKQFKVVHDTYHQVVGVCRTKE